jgi:hypothetical protein
MIVDNVQPPRRKPPNEAAGYLGYYARAHLPTVFDLVDCDGGWPPVWLYYQARGRTLRVVEEKPFGQEVHQSQRRSFAAFGSVLAIGMRTGAFTSDSGVFVLYDAERLVVPEFPVEMQRWAPNRTNRIAVNREQFDAWLLLRERAKVEQTHTNSQVRSSS